MSKTLHIGCSPLTGMIYVGTVLKDGRSAKRVRKNVMHWHPAKV